MADTVNMIRIQDIQSGFNGAPVLLEEYLLVGRLQASRGRGDAGSVWRTIYHNAWVRPRRMRMTRPLNAGNWYFSTCARVIVCVRAS